MKNLFRDSSLAEFILLTVLILTASWAGLAGDRIPGPVQELKVVSGDVDLFVRVAGKLGSGKIVMALNGGPGVSSRYMTDLEAVAGDNLALVTFDQR